MLNNELQQRAAAYDCEYANAARLKRSRVHQVTSEAQSLVAAEMVGMVDDYESVTRSMMCDLMDCRRDNTFLRQRLETSKRSERWLRAQLTAAKTSEAAQPAGGKQ